MARASRTTRKVKNQKREIKRLQDTVLRLKKQLATKESKLETQLQNVVKIKSDEDGAIDKLQRAIYGYKTNEAKLESHIETVRKCLHEATTINNKIDKLSQKNNPTYPEIEQQIEQLTVNKRLLEEAESELTLIEKEVSVDSSLIGLMWKTYREGRAHSKKVTRTVRTCKKEMSSVTKINNELIQRLTLIRDFNKSWDHETYKAARSSSRSKPSASARTRERHERARRAGSSSPYSVRFG